MTHMGPRDDDELTFPPPPEYNGKDLDRRCHLSPCPELAGLMESTGLTVLGNRWLGKTEFNPRQTALYDRVGIPITRTFESLIGPSFGKTLLTVAQRTDR